jgi:hypothetical protein
MATWDTLPILIALPLAVTVACMSGNAEARQHISGFLAEAFKPQAIDLGGDPAYSLGIAPDKTWPLPTQPDPFLQ